jgi:hypothetical protein
VCERELRDSSVRAGLAYLLGMTEDLNAINPARVAPGTGVMQMQILNRFVGKKFVDARFYFATFYYPRILHHSGRIVGADGHRPTSDDFWYLGRWQLGLNSSFPNEYWTGRVIGRLRPLMRVSEQNHPLTNFGVFETDAARKTGIGVHHHPACPVLRQFAIVQLKQRQKLLKREGINLKIH